MDSTHTSSASLKVAALLSSAAIISVPVVTSSTMTLSVGGVPQTNRAAIMFTNFGSSHHVSRDFIAISSLARWNGRRNARFNELARKEAFGDISVSEYAELEALAAVRRAEKSPRSSEEILWQLRQNEVTRELVKSLQAYVEFHESSHQA